MAFRRLPPPPGMMTLPEAAQEVGIAIPYLYGVLRGMGIEPEKEPVRTDGKRWKSRRRRLLSRDEVDRIREQLARCPA